MEKEFNEKEYFSKANLLGLIVELEQCGFGAELAEIKRQLETTAEEDDAALRQMSYSIDAVLDRAQEEMTFGSPGAALEDIFAEVLGEHEGGALGELEPLEMMEEELEYPGEELEDPFAPELYEDPLREELEEMAIERLTSDRPRKGY